MSPVLTAVLVTSRLGNFGNGFDWDRSFHFDLFRQFVLAQSLERRVPQSIVSGLTGKFELADQHRFNPMSGSRGSYFLRQIDKRRRLPFQRLQSRCHLFQCLRVESRAHLAGILQIAFGIVEADQQSAETGS